MGKLLDTTIAYIANEEPKATKHLRSECSGLLCDVNVKVALEINWVKPAGSMEEEVARQEQELMLEKEAHKLSCRLTDDLLRKLST